MKKIVWAESAVRGRELMLNVGPLRRKLFLDFLERRHPEQHRKVVDSKTHGEFLFNFAKALEAFPKEFKSAQDG